MSDLPLRIGAYRYHTTRALLDGTIPIPGVDPTFGTAATVPGIFRGFAVERRFDVAEFGLTFYLRTLDRGAPFVAIPAFPNRVFRHSCVFVNVDSGIERPEDLVDRTIGEFGVYGQDSGVWAKGILADEYGFRPELNRWVIGGLDVPSPPFDFTTHPRPAHVEITDAPDGATLTDMLERGEIDALFSANVPRAVLEGSTRVRRLFPDFEPVERDHHRRTGIFPIMHAVAAPRELLEEHPGLARALYDAFLAAKDASVADYEQARKLFEVAYSVPWLNALVERNRDELGTDWWPYGIAANHTTLDTYLRYHHEQGLSERRWKVDEVFSADLLDT